MEFYVIVGDSNCPAETTCVAPSLVVAKQVKELFEEGGAMFLNGTASPIIFTPGESIPLDILRHLPKGGGV